MAATDEELRTYHRTFLSPFYMDNLNPPHGVTKLYRMMKEVEAIRLRDPVAFEEKRKELATAKKVPYFRGYMATYRGDSGGKDHWEDGQPSDNEVADVMEPANPPQSVLRSPDTGHIALPYTQFSFQAYRDPKAPHMVQMYGKSDTIFEQWASPWEQTWSNLVPPYNTRGFTPVIDGSWRVSGHRGLVMGGGGVAMTSSLPVLVAPRSVEGMDLKTAIGMDEVAVYVAKANDPLPRGYVQRRDFTPEHRFEVFTNLDGEVHDFQVWNTGYLETP